MARKIFVPKSPEQTRLYEELQQFISTNPDFAVIKLKNKYSNKLIQTTIHELGYKTRTKKFKDPSTPEAITFKVYKYLK